MKSGHIELEDGVSRTDSDDTHELKRPQDPYSITSVVSPSMQPIPRAWSVGSEETELVDLPRFKNGRR